MVKTYIGDVYTSRNATARESEDFQTCEIGREELVFLELSAPRQLRNLSRCGFNELAKCLRPLFIDTSGKALPLSSDAMRVAVRLDEADIRLDRWT
jgi:hypothetical protein